MTMSGEHVEEGERVRAKRDEAPGTRHQTTREGRAGQKSDRGDCHELETTMAIRTWWVSLFIVDQPETNNQPLVTE